MKDLIIKLHDMFYQPIGWSIIIIAMLFAIWGAIDDLNIGCYHSAPRLILFFVIVLAPLFVALVFLKPGSKEQDS